MSEKPKVIYFEKDSRDRMMAGVEKLAAAVRVTLGPKGRAVVIRTGDARFTLDGVTVARQIVFKDECENDGAELIKQAAERCNNENGDGTTTGTILTHAIAKGGLKGVDAGLDPIRIQRGIEEGTQIAIVAIKKAARPVKTNKEVANVATISSRDPEIGAVVARAYEKIGKDGVVTTEESKAVGIHEEVVDGMEIDSGWLSPYFVTNGERAEAVLESPYVLVTSQVISSNQDIVNILSKVADSEKRSILVIADNVEGEALATLVINKMRQICRIAAIKSPSYGDNKKLMLEDIATLTGAKHFSEELGTKVEDATIEDLGRADKVIIQRGRTVIVGGKGEKKAITARAKEIKAQMDKEESDFKKDTLRKRYSRLSGGVAVIRVGSVTEAEQIEKQYRIEDAISAARSALEEGILIGGGLALVRASLAVKARAEKEKDLDVAYGLRVIAEAICAPARQVLENAGQDASVILNQIADNESDSFGFNAATGEFGDMFEEGVMDPAKVVRVALESASSVANRFISVGAVITDEPEEKVESKTKK